MTNCSKKKFFTSTNTFRGTMSSVMKLIHIFCIPSLLLCLTFESFKQASMAIVWKDICRKKLVISLEKDISPGWWDKEVDKITYKIDSELIKFSSEFKAPSKIMLKKLYLLWMIGYCWKKKQKHSVLKNVDRFFKNNPLQIYETFYNCKTCDFFGHQCNEVGLNEDI